MQETHQVAVARRYLPPVGQLSAFEAVARTGSTAAAARELDLTQGTVSRLVQALEAQLGVALFQRQRKRLKPTQAALAYAEEVRRALDIIGRASLRLASDPDGGVLALAILPTFGTHWLAPRLPGFLKVHPGITINLATRLKPFDFEGEEFDAAIHFGSPTWPRAGHMRLFGEGVVAVGAPEFLAAHPVRGAADLLSLPLLTLETRPRGWANWFAHHGVSAPVPRGMVFDQFATMMQAAIHGIGVALLPEFLATPALAEGTLSPAFGGPVDGRHAYWLVWPEGRGEHPPLAAFRDWLRAETAGLS
ncbi:LysR family transcriptional regulator [Cereibacter sphaeroides]|uniref:LysR family transcriptional regulator n=1 Tax=Cereibacter sphaeroides TaxID=1063 RepID=UPI001F16E0A1|nr:LysR family transcriptional regulator [Cereibacter sphaeroides]MCE6960959.1 LysR family transcriptional regulator [Cereibacter sphaeroides]MCE6969743.1 LysR family transcriptional regulator [Cereibacter sphaeroides]MCE6975218.1 LysR family transcriptional regulator [Cereibacter sphaeroides]